MPAPQKLCANCNTAHPSENHINTFIPEGRPVSNKMSVGKRGHTLDVTYSYKCPKCGATWKNLVESGAGGHGNFWTRIDPTGTE
jgi:hypothetical protein